MHKTYANKVQHALQTIEMKRERERERERERKKEPKFAPKRISKIDGVLEFAIAPIVSLNLLAIEDLCNE